MSARNMAKRTAAGTLALAVCLGGGAIALASAASADANFKFDTRIAGDDRYGTAIAASKAAFDKADNVILVNGYATVDGLTASYLAGVANAPILYVSDKGADDATKAEIKRLGAKNIWLVGGTTVIPTSVETAIKGDGYNVTRINGSDRYETAKLIAEAGAKIAGKQPSKVFVASGTSFADALAVSPIAYAKGYAIALTEKDSTSDFTKKELGQIGTDNKILVGGTAVVSDKVKADLSITTRVAGDDRAVTANLVSDWAKKSEGFNPANAILVGGTNGNGPDSLVASALGGKSFSTLHFAGWDATATYFKDHSAELTGKGFIFGGKAAVSDGQVSTAQSAAQTAAVVVGNIVLSSTSTSVTYADAAAKGSVTKTFSSTDKFMVDGSAASSAVFSSALSLGDVLSISTADGKNVFSLTSKKTTEYTAGLVTAFTASTGNNGSFGIGESVTGTTINTVSLSDADTTYTSYQVDGQSVSKAVFQQSVNLGDTISYTGTGADVNHLRVVSLTNASVSGVVSSVTASTFKITTDSGAELGPFTPIDADSKSSDSSTIATAVNFMAKVTAGDTVTYNVKGGVTAYALTNAKPAKVTAQVSGWTSAAGELTSVTYVPKGKAAVTVYNVPNAAGTAQMAAGATQTTQGVTGNTSEVQSLVFDQNAFGAATKLVVRYNGGAAQSVDIPSSSASIATDLQVAVRAATGNSSVTVAVGANNYTYTVTYPNSMGDVPLIDAALTKPWIYSADGALVAGAEVASALNVGDVITYQGADSVTEVSRSLALTNGSAAGVVASANTTNDTIALYADSSSTVTLGNINYTSNDGTGLSGTPLYKVNGAEKTLSVFESTLGSINSGTLNGTLKVGQSGTKVVYELSTTLA